MTPPRPVCFMVMPYGTKKTGAPTGQGLAEIDFDALWDRALRPAIEKLGYEPDFIGRVIIRQRACADRRVLSRAPSMTFWDGGSSISISARTRKSIAGQGAQ